VLPELGPYLGRLTEPSADIGGASARIEPVRVQMLTELFERAATARRADRALEPVAWLEVWGAATQAATGAVLAEAERRMLEATAMSRYPKRRIAALLPTAEDRRMMRARFSAAGIDLEAATDTVGGDVRRTAPELERAWDRLAVAAGRELDAWEQRAAGIRSWRRPWRSLVIGAVAAGLIGIWVGLVLGGYLPVPAPIRPLADWYWSLAWP
jgi:hypothetical protein